MQKEAPGSPAFVPVIIVTGPAPERAMADALAAIAAQAGLTDRAPVAYRIEDFD